MAEHITPGPAGWAQLTPEPGLVVNLRFEVAPSGRLAVAELTVARHPGVTADSLRAVRIGRIEAWANGAGRETVLAALAVRQAMTAEHTAALDAEQRALSARWSVHGLTAEAMAEEERTRAALAGQGVLDQVDAGTVAVGPGPAGRPVPLRSRVRNLKLRVPKGQPVPDAFYMEVARLWGEVSLNSQRPAAVIAEANNVPTSRVHGWVKEARRRGFLAPGERQERQR